ncbi:hypothetical protein PUNSTDRAFT_44954 [Punctularia strigosozonata HHB-11173 SS5]|uniref:uncharacterized protein n=1 Tax=Punctularia strigosozonata (strain HHB-11173) TaxID=741275 RepID=UPI0004418433|nr:uncharacterized protein PUNSTDRAFT_44954 [Punctularia strigosozonata HHB-11173 SS5]EIN08457.1 hypothetical protein PUNSTDRAFT_44954 [Punctularia strigosozonata HHB-11173 SS5]
MPALCQEVLNHIIGYIPHIMDGNSAKETLKRTSVASKATRICSQSLLYRKISIWSPKRCTDFADILLTSPHLAGGVRALKITTMYDADPQVMMNAFTLIFKGCRAITALTLVCCDGKQFVDILLPGILSSYFPYLNRLELVRCRIGNHDDLACALSCMPALSELRMKTTCVQAQAPSEPYALPQAEWTWSYLNLSVLALETYTLFTLSQLKTFTHGFLAVERLEMTVKDSLSYELLCKMVKEKRVKSLVLTLIWFPGDGSAVREDLFDSFGQDSAGSALTSLTLKGNGLSLWASQFLDAVDANQVQSVSLVLPHDAHEESWWMLDWEAVDALLGSPNKFPVLEKITIRLDGCYVPRPYYTLHAIRETVLEGMPKSHERESFRRKTLVIESMLRSEGQSAYDPQMPLARTQHKNPPLFFTDPIHSCNYHKNNN